MQPQGCRSRATVIQETYRPGRGIRAVQRVGNVEHAAVRLVLFITNQQRTCSRRVLQRFAAEIQFMMRHRSLFRRNWCFLLLFLGAILLLFASRSSLLPSLRLVGRTLLREEVGLETALNMRDTARLQQQPRSRRSDARISSAEIPPERFRTAIPHPLGKRNAALIRGF